LGALPLDPTGSSAHRPSYRLVLHVLAMRVHPTFFDLATPLTGVQSAIYDCLVIFAIRLRLSDGTQTSQ